jgi:hypothetical protein
VARIDDGGVAEEPVGRATVGDDLGGPLLDGALVGHVKSSKATVDAEFCGKAVDSVGRASAAVNSVAQFVESLGESASKALRNAGDDDCLGHI